MTFTKEQLIAAAHGRIDFANMMLSDNPEPLKERTWSIELELARIALSALRERAEPVAYADPQAFRNFQTGTATKEWMWARPDAGLVPVFVEAPSAPVVADERHQQLSELYHAQEKRLFNLAQRIKGPSFDKYAHSPSQAIDVLEAAIFGENDDACRAAMLAAPTHIATSEVTQDFKPVSRKKCMKCDQTVFGYTVNGLCEECYMSEQATPVLPECLERLLRHAHGLTSGTDWNAGTAAKFHRDPIIQAVKDCRAIFTRQPLSVEMLAGSLRNAPLAPSDNQGRQRSPVEPEWTNQQCLEFLSIAFRHAEINGDFELDDLRLGVKMARRKH